MVKSFLAKKKSKRLTCSKKFKIERKIREHNRKLKKETKAKIKKGGGTFKKKPDIHVPNKCPFKEDILREAQDVKRQEEEMRQKFKDQMQAKRKAEKNKVLSGKRSLQSVVADAENRQTAFEQNSIIISDGDKILNSDNVNKSADHSLRSYYAEVKKVIDRSDIVIQVLDARDPLGSRSREIERSIVESGKRLVLLLNKIDLIPKENVLAWLKYLRNEFPTVGFKASTQEQRKNLGRAGHTLLSSTSKCVGADLLMKLLGNYCRNKDIKTSICVGIVGYPNVGKSSIINSLKRKATCNVGAMPGITKTLQEIHLDKKIRLIDSPGVALCSKDSYDRIEMALKNVIKVDLLDDPVTPVEAILRKCTRENLMLQYKISDFDDVDEFLSNVARKIGKMKKGGVPDRRMAAKKVLHDWNSGKIRYYTVPPENATGVEMISTELVQQMSKEFDIDSIEADQKLVVDELPNLTSAHAIILPTWKEVVKIDQPSDVVMEAETTEKSALVDMTRLAKYSKSILKQAKKPGDSLMEADDDEANETIKSGGSVKLNSKMQKQFKKDKKKRKKSARVADTLASAFDNAMELDKTADYNFKTDFS